MKSEEMREFLRYVDGLEAAFKIALNVTPMEKLDIGIPDDEAVKKCAEIVRNFQGAVIAYEALKAAVRRIERKDIRDRVIKDADEMIKAFDKEQKSI
jgi:poly(A) polymerase Pap1